MAALPVLTGREFGLIWLAACTAVMLLCLVWAKHWHDEAADVRAGDGDLMAVADAVSGPTRERIQ